MEQQLPMALQVALYTASAAIVVLAAVVVPLLLRLRKQLDRVVTAVEHFEAELTPLARETRAVVDATSGLLLSPVLAFHRTTRLVQTAITTFLKALWTGRRPPEQRARAS